MEERKTGLRQLLRSMEVGDTKEIKREEWLPSSVRVSAYNVAADFGMRFRVRYRDYGVEVVRTA